MRQALRESEMDPEDPDREVRLEEERSEEEKAGRGRGRGRGRGKAKAKAKAKSRSRKSKAEDECKENDDHVDAMAAKPEKAGKEKELKATPTKSPCLKRSASQRRLQILKKVSPVKGNQPAGSTQAAEAKPKPRRPKKSDTDHVQKALQAEFDKAVEHPPKRESDASDAPPAKKIKKVSEPAGNGKDGMAGEKAVHEQPEAKAKAIPAKRVRKTPEEISSICVLWQF